jgi:hypothetical protein
MSYDIHLEIDTGGPEPAEVEDVGNYTSNCSPMWTHALGFYVGDLHGWLAVHALLLLDQAVAKMRAEPEVYRAMNPANGWGDSETATDYLEKWADACRKHPKASIYICN